MGIAEATAAVTASRAETISIAIGRTSGRRCQATLDGRGPPGVARPSGYAGRIVAAQRRSTLPRTAHRWTIFQDGIDVKKVDGEDPGRLRVQELPPRRAVSARCGIDTRRAQDL